MAYNFKQGIYKPLYPEKWVNPNNIVYRSGLEKKYFKHLERHQAIEKIASEEFYIPYYSPVDNKMHRYFVDLMVKTKTGEIWIIEIKPDSQTRPPKNSKRKKQTTFLQEALTYEINNAKWTAAKEFCRKRGYKFLIATELDLKNVRN
ncbi:head completion protein [Ochrobactrum phage vB_OspM_OC]|nr:head completion protein [Ochrobactrum phage vB_OspM_OC]